MPINKDLKSLVRARMKKTGEAYTTARAHLLKNPDAKRFPRPFSLLPRKSITPDSLAPATPRSRRRQDVSGSVGLERSITSAPKTCRTATSQRW